MKTTHKNTVKVRNAVVVTTELLRKGGLHTADRKDDKKKRDRVQARKELKSTQWL